MTRLELASSRRAEIVLRIRQMAWAARQGGNS